MAHAHVTQIPSRFGATVSLTRRHAQVIRRRRLLLLAVGVILLILAAFANYAPLHAYFDARARLAEATASIADLSAQKAEMETQLGRLGQADYLESLARQDLSYTRPGEELYIVTGTDDGIVSGQGSGGGATGRDGFARFLERLLSPL